MAVFRGSLPALCCLALALLSAKPVQSEEVCNTSQYQCGTGRCIPESWMCDGEDDCGDNTDERNCDPGEISTCQTEEFRCSTGLCIPLAWQCDGEVDCPGEEGKVDGLDEWDELCNAARCAPEEFQCRDEGNCIPQDWTCDGHSDCTDGSDETVCNVTCSEEEFQCDNSDCIQVRWKCDGERDCSDGSDETDCHGRTCDSVDQFTCDSGMCVSTRWRCDGEMDCDDGSDEQGCKKAINSSSDCGKNSFVCKNQGDCIHKEWVCDGDRDCTDGSDETEETCGPVIGCSEEQFKCSNGDCIPAHLKCSGGVECLDGSDELDCSDDLALPGSKCDPYTEFDCGPGKPCLPQERVCDLRNDCGDWEDEPKEVCGLKTNECKKNNGGCDQLCVDTADGFFCDCKPGFKLSGNNTCEDVDECQILGSCSQNCQNFVGSHTCSCRPGYRSEPSRPNSCKVEVGKVGLLITHQSDIRVTDTLGREMRAVVENTRSATLVDFHYKATQVFWIDSVEKRIYRSSMLEGKADEKQGMRRLLVEGGVGKSDGMAVDWVNNNLYWTDSGRQTISMTNYNGEWTTDVISEGLEKPRSLAVHPKKGWLFWSDYGDKPRIEKAGMDGSLRVELVTENVMWPNSITLDLVQERLYWVDAKLHLIGSIGLDGSRPNIISEPGSALHHPVSVSVLEDWVYWTEWNQNGSVVYKANKFDGSELAKVTEASLHLKPMSLAVWHSYRQPPMKSLCIGRSPACSHLCAPAPKMLRKAGVRQSGRAQATSCLCPRNMVLGTDGATCVSSQQLDPAVIEHVDTMIGDLQAGAEEGKNVKVPEAEQQQQQPEAGADDLQQAVEVLKEKQEQKNLYTGLIIGLITGVGILCLLVGIWVWRRCSGDPGSQESLRKPSSLSARGIYSPPRSHTVHISESESTVPLQRGTPESDMDPAS